MTILDTAQWDDFIETLPSAHILQTSAWGELKANFDWQPVRVRVDLCGAQVLFRRLPLGFTIGYIPKGPVGSGWKNLWPEIERVCRRMRAIFLKVEPDGWETEGIDWQVDLKGFIPAKAIQPQRTIEISLEGSAEDRLARMKQKTRYNIRLAERKDVVVRQSDDVDMFHRMMLTTGERDRFGVHSLDYYRKAYQLFSPGGGCSLLVAEYNHLPLAALMVFAHGQRAWYFYGASTNEERNRMPAYLLQWEAMRWAAERGCKVYDLWGIPDEDEDRLELDFSEREDGLWGVFRFKRGFGGRVCRSAGAWDKPFQPVLYRLYQIYAKQRGGEG